MTAYDTDARTLAAGMLDLVSAQGFGQAVTVTQPGAGGSYDPASGSITGGADTSETGAGVLLDYPISLRSRGGQGDQPGSLILETDKQLLLSPLKSDGSALTTPAAGWSVTVSGVAYVIVNVGTLAPAGTIIYHDCHVRKA